ncbi:hypothetical protein GGTG_11132 [Gaeumannomyces tritici R3-111a-1]|uniref:Uncharacterized protein n=1 Tax=Gaeumannomyces tritici (strain R3-111a-1) TaxID=644352 RepID=J3PCA9_GAET3|nr:hypothetical protein GGTG_11132 [Gaeumannomyces tritici R3-111a-1]EJT71879.1 hypothetical protein GGTG_11132 [Gaeumannomyces tritici R3-111a-1]
MTRAETNEMRTYPLDMADRLQRLARDGIEGRYADPFFGNPYNDQGPVVQRFKEQAKPWRDIAALHLELVSVYAWLDELLRPYTTGFSIRLELEFVGAGR